MTEKDIQLELDRMDGGLFLDKESDKQGRVFYSIKHLIDGIPYTAVDWRYPDSSPRPLTPDILVQLRGQEGDIKEALRTAMVNNAVAKELARQKAVEESQEVAQEWDRYKRGTKFVSHGPGGMDHKTSLNKRDI